MTLPFISCCCKTFARVQTLEETLKSFLDQDYAGKKQLVIYNDFPSQELVFDHPEVKIINSKAREKTLGDGRNSCIAESDGDVICSMDDDDIYLPHHLTTMNSILGRADYARYTGYYYALNWRVDSFVSGNGNFLVHTRKAWRSVGGYASMNTGEDVDFTRRLTGAGLVGEVHQLTRENAGFVYHWGNGVHHISGTRDEPGRKSGYEACGDRAEAMVKSGSIPSGRIELVPRWKADWIAQVNQFNRENP